MLPDAYGLLGMARREEGPEALSEAENLLREAVRLAPEDPTQVPRLVSLLVARARVENEHRDALRAEARELLERITRGDRKTPEGFLLLAQIVREDGAEIERAEWLLDKARKLTDRAHERMFRVRLEKALLDAAHGKLIDAEAGIRELGKKDPSNAEVFVALAQVLWQQDQVIPAHAELMRAQSRCAPGSLERAYIDRKLTELQALIEAQAAGLMDAGSEDGSVLPVPINAAGHNRVIRRRKGDEEPQAATSEQPTGVTLMPVEPPLSPPSEVEGEKAPSSEADAHHH
jgi:predicted Zn-dependent protease